MVLIKRYRGAIFSGVFLAALFAVDYGKGAAAVKISGSAMMEMLSILPPVFILLGLLDVWVPRETMMKLMGEKSGILGIVLAFIFGSAAVGPLYGAFPVAAVFMKKGVKFSNVLIFIGAWSTTKIPMLLFELSSMGPRFAVTRLALNIPGIIIMAWLLQLFISQDEITRLYENIENNHF